MKDQINTIREALVLGIKAINHLGGAREAMPLHDAMPALTQLEAMAGEPVARLHITETDTYPDIEVEVLDGTHLQPGMSPIPVYVAAPVAQQYEAGDMASAAAQGFRDGVASVTQQEPVAWAMPKGDGTFIDVITPAEHARDEGNYTVPLFAHPVAHQPTFDAQRALEAIEALLSNIRRDAPSLSGKAMGFAEEVAAALRDKVALQPQAEAVPAVDRVYEAAKRLVDHADFQLGGVLSAKSKARDIPSNAASKVKARHLASLRDALAKTPHQAEAVPQAAEFCWLVEHFDIADKSTGHYYTGKVGIADRALTTMDPHQAKRYDTWRAANIASAQLGSTLTGTWRAMQHGFHRMAPRQAEAVPLFAALKVEGPRFHCAKVYGRIYQVLAVGSNKEDLLTVARLAKDAYYKQFPGTHEYKEPPFEWVVEEVPTAQPKFQPTEAVPPDVVRDAERWRMLPAYFYEYQIDAMKLYRDIDAAIAQQKGGV